MYNPSRFKSENWDEAFRVMDHHPFATVISTQDGQPVISHLPLTPRRVGDGIELIGHMARANPHWKLFAGSRASSQVDSQASGQKGYQTSPQPNVKVTAVFHGPHTYITPTWYTENDVPTWNYSVVHASGVVELIESHDGIVECLQELTTHVERHWPSGWELFIPEDLNSDVLPKAIVGFRIKVDEIQFKMKLSQNRSPADRAGVLNGLKTRTDENSQLVLRDMLKIFSVNGEVK